MTTPMLPPLGSVYYETLSPHIIVVVTGHDAFASLITFKRMDTGRDIVADAPTFTYHYSPLETMETK